MASPSLVGNASSGSALPDKGTASPTGKESWPSKPTFSTKTFSRKPAMITSA
eukprot:CAMPEP_0176172398 /NCGR_PEP_ID=MMETSP0120_2-20121206/88325_1 /TAXON_ID=160619 /ORGANISM="Kryptoperidinium foliaceum, Strain CCMP 1326" /LENGTH=51 /DNA_ID=CAMNT_0017510383 /DNA_START=21 /DNA_END=173 /DNA_ORIENTATION=-